MAPPAARNPTIKLLRIMVENAYQSELLTTFAHVTRLSHPELYNIQNDKEACQRLTTKMTAIMRLSEEHNLTQQIRPILEGWPTRMQNDLDELRKQYGRDICSAFARFMTFNSPPGCK
jgi:hypothetical protein